MKHKPVKLTFGRCFSLIKRINHAPSLWLINELLQRQVMENMLLSQWNVEFRTLTFLAVLQISLFKSLIFKLACHLVYQVYHAGSRTH